MRYYQLLIVISFVVAVLNNAISTIDVLFLALSVLLMLFITGHFPFLKHFGKHLVLLTFWISLLFMPAFHLVKSLQGDDSVFGYGIDAVDYARILSFGSKVLLITCLSWLSLYALSSKRQNKTYVYTPKPISKASVRWIFIVMFGLSLFSLSIGLSRMGTQGVELPFHLAGIITLIRISFFPAFFAIITENYILNKKKIPFLFFILLFLWGLLETVVRLSKSSLLGAIMPVGLVLFMYYRPNLRTIIRYAAPVIVVFLALYPIIGTMRSMGEGSFSGDFLAASRQEESVDNLDNPFIQPLNRTFMIPAHYAKDYQYINHNSLFDFSRMPVLLAIGGAERYQTFVIDGYPPGIAHSSGTTALEDPLLHGGYGLCYIVILLLMIMATAIDALFYKRMISVYIFLVLLLWSFCNTHNISVFYNGVGLQYLFVRIAIIWLAYFINFKKRKVLTEQL